MRSSYLYLISWAFEWSLVWYCLPLLKIERNVFKKLFQRNKNTFSSWNNMILFSLFPVLTHYSKWVTGSCPLILKNLVSFWPKKMKNIILCNNLKGPVDYLKLHKYLSFKKVYWIFYSFLMLSNNYHYNFLIFSFWVEFFLPNFLFYFWIHLLLDFDICCHIMSRRHI